MKRKEKNKAKTSRILVLIDFCLKWKKEIERYLYLACVVSTPRVCVFTYFFINKFIKL